MRETWVWSLGQEDSLEEKMATHPSIFAWKIPWTGAPSGLQSIALHRVGHNWVSSLSCRNCRRCWFDPLVGKSPGGGHDNPLQYSSLENSVNRGAWRATVHRVAKSQTRLSTHAHTGTSYNWNHAIFVLCVGLISFSMFSKFTCVVTCIRISLLFMVEHYHIVCIYYSLFVHWSVESSQFYFVYFFNIYYLFGCTRS